MLFQPEYSWFETESNIQVSIPLKGQKASKVDIFATEYLLKVSFAPYFLSLDLSGAIDEEKSKAVAKHGILNIKIGKKVKGIWGTLIAEGSKNELKERREASIQARRKKDEELQTKAKDRKVEEERQATRDQMAVDSSIRQKLEELKAEEKAREEEAMYKAFAELEASKQKSTPAPSLTTPQPIPSVPKKERSVRFTDEVETEGPPDSKTAVLDSHKSIFTDKDIEQMLESDDESDRDHQPTPVSDEEFEAEDDDLRGEILEDNLEAYVPQPRASEKVEMSFTPRLFPTPARESKQREEEDWIIKNRVALKKNQENKNKLPKHLADISETDAYWLKAKGDEFFKAKDYRSAASAYTSGLEGDPEMVPCLSNRAACYLKLGEFTKCILDCSEAMEALVKHRLMTPEAKQATRAKLLVRRGTAYCQLAIYDQALKDYRDAVLMDTSNMELITDLKRLQSLANCYELKKEGDAIFSKGNMEGAKEKYTEVLHLEPTFVSCLSNRAACHLALNNLDACISDCTVSLELLEAEDLQSKNEIIQELGPAIPMNPVGQKRNRWILKTICRRAMARVQQGNIEEALKDYEKAHALSPDDALILNDIQQLKIALSQS